MVSMERFTQRARQVLSLAHQETERTHSNSIGTEYLLIGLIVEEGGVGSRVLRELGLSTDRVREAVGRVTTASNNFDPSHIGLSFETQEALTYAVEEFRRTGHHNLETGHILLGLVRANDTAADVLQELGINADMVLTQAQRALNKSASVSRATSSESASTSREIDRIRQALTLLGRDEQKNDMVCMLQFLTR